MNVRLSNWYKIYEQQKMKMLGYGAHNYLPLPEETYKPGDKVTLKSGDAYRPVKGGIGALEKDTEFEVVNRGGRTVLTNPEIGDVLLTQEALESTVKVVRKEDAETAPGSDGGNPNAGYISLSQLSVGDQFKIPHGVDLGMGRILSNSNIWRVISIGGGYTIRDASATEITFSKSEADKIVVLSLTTRPMDTTVKGAVLAG